MNNPDTTKIDSLLLQLTVLTFAFVGGTAAFTVLAVILGPVGDEPFDPAIAQVLVFVSLGIALAETAAMFVIYPAQTRRLLAAESIDDRIPILKGRTILMLSFGQGSALFAAVVMMLTGVRFEVSPGFVPLVLALAMVMPTRARITRDLTGKGLEYR